MADLTITAANVDPVDGYTSVTVIAGAAITAGQVCYLDTSNLAQLSDANASAVTAAVKGIALNNAAANQPVTLMTAGDLDVGASLTVSETYILSATAGGIAPIADLASGWYVIHLGIATAADNLRLRIFDPDAQKA